MRHVVSALIPSSSLGIVLALAASACGGGGGGATTTPAAPAIRLDGPTATDVGVGFAIATTPEQGDATPQSTIDLVLTGSDGQIVRTTVAGYPAECSAQDVPEGSDVVTVRCWWAGAGLTVHAVREGDELVIRKLSIFEEAEEDMAEAIETHRFALTAGANVHAEATEAP